jgi:hypothetical protein
LTLLSPAVAGTLSCESTSFDWSGDSEWVGQLMSNSVTAVAGTLPGGAGWLASSTSSASGTVKVMLKYVGSTTDQPPTNVTITRPSSMNGNIQYSFLGRTPPSGSGSASYSGDSVDVNGYPALGLSDSVGPIYQASTNVSGNVPGFTNIGTINVSTPVTYWTQTITGTTVVYRYEVLIASPDATASASTSINWRSSNIASRWEYKLDLSGITAQ